MPTSLAELLRVVERAVSRTRAKVAVGGGVAVRTYGYNRTTTDVDVFLRDEDRPKFFKAIRESGMVIAPLMPPAHYIAMFVGDPPDVRIDLLFPAGNPELDAIEDAKKMRPEGIGVRVVPIEHLIAMKIIAYYTRNESQDLADVERLYSIGAFEPIKVLSYMKTLEEDYVSEFLETMKAIKARHGKASIEGIRRTKKKR